MRIGIALLALALATTGCKKKENKPADMAGSGSAMAGSGSAAMAGSGSDMGSAGSGSAMAGSDMGSGSAAMAGSGSAAGSAADATSMAHHAGNCPSTVFGSTTKAELKGKDVVVTISATDKDAIKSIQMRTDELLKDKSKKAAGSADMSTHDQKGTHGGSIGICPIHIPEGATAKAKHDKGGVTVTITPKDKPDDLKKEIDARIPKAEQWVKDNIKPGDKGTQGGVGGGKGEHGANHSGEGDSKGQERKKEGKDGSGGGKGTGGGGGKGTGGGSGSGSAKK